MVPFVFLTFSVFMFFLGAYYHESGRLYGVRDMLRANYRIPFNYARGLTSRPTRLDIDIKHKHYQRLAYNREIALQRGALLPDVRDEVPAFLRFEDKVIKARVRLKGDLPDHWRDEKKWSFRIQARGENTFLGMKQFSIQDPKTRAMLTEWFLHRFLAHNGLIGLRYDFIAVTVNGTNLGLYAVQEHLEKRLIENNRNREGPLFRVATAFYWYHKPGLARSVYGGAVDAFQTRRMAANPAISSQFRVARNLFEAFREGDLPTHQVFDVEKLAKSFAILDLMGHFHAASLDNLAFYYNPVTSRIEPVVSDTGLQPATTLIGASKMLGLDVERTADTPADWLDLLFRDPIFFSAYVRELEKISESQLLDDFFRQHDEQFQEKLRILHRSSPWYNFEPDKKVLYRNQQFIRNYLTPVKSVQAYFRDHSQAAKTLELEVASIHTLPIEIEGASLAGALLEPIAATILQPHRSFSPVAYRSIAFQLPPELAWADSMVADLEIHHRILGAGPSRQDGVHPWPHRSSDFLEHDFIRQPPNFEDFEFLELDSGGKRIAIAAGDWELSRNLIVPPGYTVTSGPGTRLNLTRGAKLLSYSPLELLGSSDEPIVIESTDSTGQGLAVLRAGGRSVLEYVHFVNLSTPEEAGWQLTGAVTFYESPVTFSRCAFSASRSEDALNVIRGEFLIEQTVFERSSFDAIDVDFGDGRIVATSFVDSGNDAIDISGTALELEDILVNGTGDKGLSGGENSHMRGRRITIRAAEIAVASKDLTDISLDVVEIDDSRVGFVVFQKKPEFGPGQLAATGVTLSSVEVPYLLDERSRASMNGRNLAATHRNVEELLYGAQYGKSSR